MELKSRLSLDFIGKPTPPSGLKLRQIHINTTVMKSVAFVLMALMLGSCAVIRPGEVGIKSRLGRLSGMTKESGAMGFNPFTSRVIKIPTRTINREVFIALPSKEGLTINSEISILYRIKADMARQVVEEIGMTYDNIITSVFRSSAADVTSRYFAKDMHSGQRDHIEKEIAEKMNGILGSKGFEIEAVLMKSIVLPAGLARAIEEKLEAEQNAQRMDFILMTEKKEAERRIIDAQATRDAQILITEGLTEQILQLRSIEAMREFAKSNSTKLIITDGKSPMFLGPGMP
jgi:prohibitin 1